MADNAELNAGSGGITLAIASLTFSGDTAGVQVVGCGILSGSESNWTLSRMVGGAGAVEAGVQRVTLASDDPAVVDLAAMEVLLTTISGNITACNTGAVVISSGTITAVTDITNTVTVDGTVAATQSGTWNLTDISGTISLPTGAATETTVAAVKTAVELIDDAVATISSTDVLKVAIYDDSDTQITTFGGGTQYTEGATDATITGTVAMWEDAADTVVATSAAKPLPVEVIAGATSGTEYTEGDADATITGTAAMMEVAADTLQPVQGTVADGLLVNLGSNNDVTLATLPDTAAGDLAAMVVDLDAIEVLLGTIDADTSTLAAVDFATQTTLSALNDKVTACDTGAVVIASGSITVTSLDNLPGTAAESADLPGVFMVVAGDDGTDTHPLQTDVSGNLKVTVIKVDGTVAATQSGAWNITDISGTISLPTGAATETTLGSVKTAVELIDNAATTIASTNVLRVALFDDADTQITAFSGGTQYTEDEVAAADPKGTMPVMVREDGPVSIAADGDVVAQRATAYGAAYVQVLDSSGNFINTFGGAGGTSSADDDDFDAGTTLGTQIQGVYESSPTSVNDGDVGQIGITATRQMRTSASQEGTWNIATVTTCSTVTNVAQLGGQAVTMGEGVLDAGCQRVTLATDDDGVAHLATIAGDTTSLDGKDFATETTLAAVLVDTGQIETLLGTIDTDTGVIAAGYAIEGDPLGSGVLIQGDDGTDRTNVLVDTDGHLQVDVLSGASGGTAYTEDVATADPIVGTATMMERDDALTGLTPDEGEWASLRCSAEGALWVQDFNSDALLAETAAMVIDLAAIETVLDTIEGYATTIAADTSSIDGNTGDIVTAVETVADCVAGSELQVDVVAPVTVVGSAAEDAAASGNPVLIGGRYDSTERTTETTDATTLATSAQGWMMVGNQSSYLFDGATRCQIKRASGVAASETTAIAALHATKKLRVLALALFATSATVTNVYLATTTDTDVLGNAGNPIPLAVDADGDNSAGFVLPYNQAGWTETSTENEALNLILSAAQDVIWALTWIEVD